MKVVFQLRFHSRFGQKLALTGDHPLFGSGDLNHALPLAWINDQAWQVSAHFQQVPPRPITYHYVLFDLDGSIIEDWGKTRILRPEDFSADEILVLDSWNYPGFYQNAFFTEPFSEVLLAPKSTLSEPQTTEHFTHTFRVRAPLLKENQTVCLLGSDLSLSPQGKPWDEASPILLGRKPGDSFFSVQVDLAQAAFPFNYKYAVYDLNKGLVESYEGGSNRILLDTVRPGKRTIVDDGFANLPSTSWKGAGVAVPVFSLRSKRSHGVGDFTDLKLLVDWTRQCGLRVIQILPINDTSATHTWTDSYPYAAISAFALHPLYLDLEALVIRPEAKLLRALEGERKRLNQLDAVDYEAVMNHKMGFLKKVFPTQKEQTFASTAFREFYAENESWLKPYAAFCVLRDRFGSADFTQWPEHQAYSSEAVNRLLAADQQFHEEWDLHCFIQFQLHAQLSAAAAYAHQNGIILKGDIAIGVSRYGADAWQSPELFHMDMQAGAPPDAFAVKGQNWGFPTYNWPRMKETHFAWWKQRFHQMSHYFDAFRIDHILGFFRIWNIPLHAVEGILGYFVPALPVHVSEFATRGIPFDRDRFSKPYITEAIVRKIFGTHADRVLRDFLDSDRFGNVRLKPEFAQQRLVENYFSKLEKSEENAAIKTGLFDLISNVLLLEAPGGSGQEFHFRFGIEETLSFQSLDPDTQQRLKDLYVDYFYRRQDSSWRQEALQKLPALKRVTNMLVCGEDLGMVPACVPDVMRDLGLLSLEIQRMPKLPGQQFFRPSTAPYLSVVTPSTHDMSTIRGWWEEDAALSQIFYSQELGLPGLAPRDCEPLLNRVIVAQHLESPAMWSIFQLQDLLGMSARLRRDDPGDERINIPANPRHYWRYRMHLNLEDLLTATEFSSELLRMVRAAGR